MIKSPTIRLIFTSTIALLLVSGAFTIYSQLFRYINNTRTSLNHLEMKIKSLETERKEARTAAALMEERKEDINSINNFFVDRGNLLPFIEELERLAKDSHNIIALDLNEQGNTSDILTFRLTIEGTQKTALKYLELLEMMPYEIIIEDLTSQKITRGIRLILSIQVKTKT